MLTRGSAGGTRWWYVAYSTLLGSPQELSPCLLLVGDDGKPFPGGGGCAISTGGQYTGSTLGFSHIGGHDFVAGETYGDVDFVEIQSRSGTALVARTLVIPRSTSKAWVIELPTTGDLAGYLERSQAVIKRISTVSNGQRTTIFPLGPP